MLLPISVPFCASPLRVSRMEQASKPICASRTQYARLPLRYRRRSNLLHLSLLDPRQRVQIRRLKEVWGHCAQRGHQPAQLGTRENKDAPSRSHSGLISMTCRAYSREVMTSSNHRIILGGGWCWNMLELGWMLTVWFVLRKCKVSKSRGRGTGEAHLMVR